MACDEEAGVRPLLDCLCHHWHRGVVDRGMVQSFVCHRRGGAAVFSFGSLLIAVAVAALTPIRGFGLWSAQTVLIHNLARPAVVVPAAGLRIFCAVAARWRLTAPPKPGAVVARGAAWRPYPSYAAAMLWRSLIPGAEESDPKARALLAEASRRAIKQEPR